MGYAGRFEGWEKYAILVLQVVLGLIFMAHGAQKLFGAFGGSGIAGLAGYFTKIGIVPGLFWAWIVGLVEFFGGLCILLGLVTRIAAALIVIDMTVAVFWVHFPTFFWQRAGRLAPGGLEMPMTLGIIALALFLAGPSFLSIDRSIGLEKRST